MQKGFSLILVIAGILILGVLGGGGYYFLNLQKLASIKNFEDCSKHYPVLLSYPGQCNTPDGRHFVQELSEEEKEKLIPPKVEESTSGDDLDDTVQNYVSPLPSPLVMTFDECVQYYKSERNKITKGSNVSILDGSVTIHFNETINSNTLAKKFIQDNKLELISEPSLLPAIAQVSVPKGREEQFICKFNSLDGVQRADFVKLIPLDGH